MKVYKGEPKRFEPITIVLETQDEADMLWHKFNIGEMDTYTEYCSRKSIDEHNNLRYGMWKMLNGIHKPERE